MDWHSSRSNSCWAGREQWQTRRVSPAGRHRGGLRRARGRHVSAGEFSGDALLDTEDALDDAAQALRANADRLAERGLLVALEAFPWSAITNAGIAIDLLRRADAPNAAC
jgi:sugar phosphate isomerase/epimerase